MFKEYLLLITKRNPILTEDKPFLYSKILNKIERMSEDECKSFLFKEGSKDRLYKLIAGTSVGLTASSLVLGRRKMKKCKELANKIKDKDEKNRALSACHSGGI